MYVCHSQDPNNWEGRGAMFPIHIMKGQAKRHRMRAHFSVLHAEKRGTEQSTTDKTLS